MTTRDERGEGERKRQAEHAIGDDRKRTPPVSGEAVKEPVDPSARPQGAIDEGAEEEKGHS